MQIPELRADGPTLQAFVAVARLGTVGRAAEALGRAQPSISARVRSLEEGLGTRLFARRVSGMRLTAEGRRLLPLAEAALRALEEVDRAAGLPVAPGGELRVGSGDALGRELLPAVLARLLAEDAATGVRLLEGPGPRLLEALRGGEIDVALCAATAEPPEGDDVEWRRLLRTPVVLLRPTAVRPGGVGRAVGPATLAGERLVSLQPGSAFRRHLEAAFEAAGQPFRPAVEVGNLSLVRRCVGAGLGVAPVPAVAFGAGDRRSGVAVGPVRRIPSVTYFRATRRDAPLPPPAARFLELLERPTRC